jgi:uncharacterized protein (DUF58 family)
MTLATLDRPRSPAQPGPGPTPEALLRALDLTVARRIRGLLPGEFRAHDLGGGTELAQVRPYEAGDDVRRIDWNVTARTTIPHFRVHVPERALTAWLLLDVSPSMTFGTADRRKADVAEGVALAVGHLATQRGNRLGLVTFGGHEDRRLAPTGGRFGRLALLRNARLDTEAVLPVDDQPSTLAALRDRLARRELTGQAPVDQRAAPVGVTSAARALRLLASTAARGGLVVVVSDFRGPRDWLQAIAGAGAHHHVLAVEIRDPREDDLPDVGELTLIDAETGHEVRIDSSSRQLRQRFAEAASSERASLATDLRRVGVRHVVLSTSGDWLRSLASQLRLLGIAS